MFWLSVRFEVVAPGDFDPCKVVWDYLPSQADGRRYVLGHGSGELVGAFSRRQAI